MATLALIHSRSTTAASTENKFVQLALERTLALAVEVNGAGTLANTLGSGLDVAIVGDNDFYSQRAQVRALTHCIHGRSITHDYTLQLSARGLPPTLDSLSQLPPFAPTGVRLADVHKTGLGSSAALITSLVSALLLHLHVVPADAFATQGGTTDASEGRKLAHNLAQYVHCLAQGKVGSGFDVSAAAFGSQLYTRFDPAVLKPLMEDGAVRVLLVFQLARANLVSVGGSSGSDARRLARECGMESSRAAFQAAAADTPDARGRRRGKRHAVAGGQGPQMAQGERSSRSALVALPSHVMLICSQRAGFGPRSTS